MRFYFTHGIPGRTLPVLAGEDRGCHRKSSDGTRSAVWCGSIHGTPPRTPTTETTRPPHSSSVASHKRLQADGKYVTCQELKWCSLGNSRNFLINFCIFRSEFSLFSVMKRDVPFGKYITSMLMIIYQKAMILATM